MTEQTDRTLEDETPVNGPSDLTTTGEAKPATTVGAETPVADPAAPQLETPSRRPRGGKGKAKSLKVGDTVDLDGRPGFLRYPDGTVATCRGSVTFREDGEHTVILGDTETVYKVAKAEG